MRPPFLLLCGAALLLAGCATTHLDAQWQDPQQPPRLLRGQTVLVACDAYEVVVRRLCQDQFVAQFNAQGVRAVASADPPPVNPWRPAPASQWIEPARMAGAAVVFSASVVPGLASTKPGFSIGFGLGSFGSNVGGGIGVSAPIGGGQQVSGYIAEGQFTDITSGKPLWTAKLSSEASSDVNRQLADLAQAMTEAARKAGFF